MSRFHLKSVEPNSEVALLNAVSACNKCWLNPSNLRLSRTTVEGLRYPRGLNLLPACKARTLIVKMTRIYISVSLFVLVANSFVGIRNVTTEVKVASMSKTLKIHLDTSVFLTIVRFKLTNNHLNFLNTIINTNFIPIGNFWLQLTPFK